VAVAEPFSGAGDENDRRTIGFDGYCRPARNFKQLSSVSSISLLCATPSAKTQSTAPRLR